MLFRSPVVRFFSRILNRVTITVVLVALQLLWLCWVAFAITTGTGRVWVNGLLNALSLLIVLYLVRKDENSAYKVGWIALIGILPLLGGASLLALKSGCDVVPVYIEGHYKPFRRMVVHVGKPIEMADLRAGRMNKETCDALTERMEAAFARLSGGKSLLPAEKTPA